mmetsp:Transcript_8761/g.30145  ORF Transcript_8761/g.30145 Transcript_8761/m.30145 type:complete len:329 (-) Transcript_8761:341-1327(-)
MRSFHGPRHRAAARCVRFKVRRGKRYGGRRARITVEARGDPGQSLLRLHAAPARPLLHQMLGRAHRARAEEGRRVDVRAGHRPCRALLGHSARGSLGFGCGAVLPGSVRARGGVGRRPPPDGRGRPDLEARSWGQRGLCGRVDLFRRGAVPRPRRRRSAARPRRGHGARGKRRRKAAALKGPLQVLAPVTAAVAVAAGPQRVAARGAQFAHRAHFVRLAHVVWTARTTRPGAAAAGRARRRVDVGGLCRGRRRGRKVRRGLWRPPRGAARHGAHLRRVRVRDLLLDDGECVRHRGLRSQRLPRLPRQLDGALPLLSVLPRPHRRRRAE